MNHLRQHWETVVRDKVQLAVQKIKQESSALGSTDVLRWWMYMASDISALLMFGESFRMVETGKVCLCRCFILTLQPS